MDTQARPILVWSLVGQPGQEINGSRPWNAMEMTCQYPNQTAKYMHIKGLKKKRAILLSKKIK
jgi:hypothetical protein